MTGPDRPTDGRRIDRVLRRLDGRFVFVVGKGGVGKTTTAAALALRWADRGTPTRVISTDPAHSLVDVLGRTGQEVPGRGGEVVRDRTGEDDGGVLRDVCGAPLIVESFDARAYADRWIADAREPVAELFELGTYLEADEAGRFLDLSLPGLDEVMGALRLEELVGGPEGRIVVDTPPTGHALRLLDAAEVLGSWVRALRAMSRKATAVAEGLTRREVRLAADGFVDLLEERVGRFEREVLGEAAFVTVTRPDRVVESRTEHLRRALAERGLELRVEVSVGTGGARATTASSPPAGTAGTAAPADAPGGPDGPGAGDEDDDLSRFVVPLRPDPTGCEALRCWGEPAPATADDAAAGAAPDGRRAAKGADRFGAGGGGGGRDGPPAALRRLLRRRVTLVAGKGGVGKSTCAAACAAWASGERRTVLVGTDPDGALSDVLGVRVPRDGVEVAPDLVARQLDAEAELSRFRQRAGSEIERIAEGLGVGREAELDRDVVASLLELAPPGIDEIFALVVVMELMEERDGEREAGVVVDAAPTGHFLRLIGMPEVALQWIHALMRILLEYRAVAGLDDAAERLLELARRVRRLRSTLVDAGRTTPLLVTLGEPVVAAESRRLHRRMAEAGMRPAAWIHNRSPAGGSATEPDLPDGVPRFVAPLERGPLRGVEALRAFVARWEPVT